MKKTIFALSFFVAAQAFAGSAVENSNTRSLSYRVNNLIQETAEQLSNKKLRQIQDLLSQVQDVALGLNSTPAPQPKPSKRIQMNGLIESVSFSFTISNLNELHRQCHAFVANNGLNRVDEISVSVDFQPTVQLNNSASYWLTATQVCEPLMNVARSAGIVADVSRVKTVTGTIETTEFLFQGRDLAELNNTCTAFVNNNGLNRVDEISLSVNYGEPKALNNSVGYWTTTFDICQQILQNAR